MKLNRDNYEEYFILYLDNELSSEDRREVDVFASENPDLRAELDMLLQSKVSPDTDIVFGNKESLMIYDSSAISMNNYEEWLLSYIDNELSEQEIKDVERFVAEHPSVKKELELFQKTKLQPETIAFPDIQSLYRKEEKAKVIAINWRRIAVAAVLLVGISTTAVLLLNSEKGNGIPATAGISPKTEKSTTEKVTSPVTNPVEEKQPIAQTNPEKTEVKKESLKNNPGIIKQNNTIRKENDNQKDLRVTPEENTLVKTKQDNNLPKPEFNPHVTGKIEPKQNDAIVNTKISPEILTNQDTKTAMDGVTLVNLQPSEEIEQPSGKKNKLRGFFRKVTRTFEKRTNMKATDEDDNHLLIAGLSIKLN